MNEEVEPKNSRFQLNMNSLIMSVCTLLILAPLSLVWSKTNSTNDAIVKLETSLPYIRESQSELKTQITALSITISSMVTRSELDRKLDELNRAITRNSSDISDLKRDLERAQRALNQK